MFTILIFTLCYEYEYVKYVLAGGCCEQSKFSQPHKHLNLIYMKKRKTTRSLA